MTGSSAAVVDLGTMHARPVVLLPGDAIPYRERWPGGCPDCGSTCGQSPGGQRCSKSGPPSTMPISPAIRTGSIGSSVITRR